MARILLVEDDSTLAGLIEQLLRLADHQVATVTTPEALTRPAEPVDLVITDLFDSGRDRVALAEYLDRLRSIVGSIPIVVCSGQAQLSQAKLASLEVADVITKPFDVEDFLRRVEQALNPGTG